MFELPCIHQDDNSAVYTFGGSMINILQIEHAPELIDAAPVAAAGTGARSMFTVKVDDVDAVHVQLVSNGVEFLKGPIDPPWGLQTATFADPAGHMWEIAGWFLGVPVFHQ